MISNFGLIMLSALLAIGVGVIVAIFNNKKKKWNFKFIGQSSTGGWLSTLNILTNGLANPLSATPIWKGSRKTSAQRLRSLMSADFPLRRNDSPNRDAVSLCRGTHAPKEETRCACLLFECKRPRSNPWPWGTVYAPLSAEMLKKRNSLLKRRPWA